MEQQVLQISLGMVKAFIIKGEKHILVDTGLPKNYDKIIKFFNKHSIEPSDIGLIVITHNHTDHVGELVKLQELTGAKVVIHKKEGINLRSGKSTPVKPITLGAKLLFKVMKEPKAVLFEPHIEVEDMMDLSDFGIKGKILHTPGHTDGSISIILENGEVIVGDMITGKQTQNKSKAKLPFIANDLNEIKKSLQRLVQEGGKMFYTSHGDKCDVEAVKELL